MAQLTPATLDTAPIRLTEPHLVARLRLAFPERAFEIQRCNPTMTVREFERLARLSPFIGIAFTGFKTASSSGRRLDGVMNWRLILIVKISDLERRFKGDPRDIGMDAMVDVASVLLHGWTIDDVGSVSVSNANAVFADGYEADDVSIVQIDFEVAYSASPAALALKTPGDLEMLAINWLAVDGDAAGASPPDVSTDTRIKP